jgi:hypothetical protein
MTSVSLFVWLLHLDLSGLGGPTSSYTTAGIALRVSGALKPHHYDKVGIASVGVSHATAYNYTSAVNYLACATWLQFVAFFSRKKKQGRMEMPDETLFVEGHPLNMLPMI